MEDKMPGKCCPNCGHSIAPAVKRAAKAKRASKAIVFAGRKWSGQEAAYRLNLRVKAGELVWDAGMHPDRFGVRGDFVTPERYAENQATYAANREHDAATPLPRPHGGLFVSSKPTQADYEAFALAAQKRFFCPVCSEMTSEHVHCGEATTRGPGGVRVSPDRSFLSVSPARDSVTA
jgi:hypothetical protein